MILIYVDNITPRVSYTINLVFDVVLGVAYKITDNKKEFNDFELPKISYCNDFNFSKVSIIPNSLLFETQIKNIYPTADVNYFDYPKFFASPQKDFLGYDIFAMVFYFVTRYEEYLDAAGDDHQRFKAENSIAFKYNCLNIPFLNAAICDFSEKLKTQFPLLNFNKRAFNFVSTIDIDNAFAYSHKGLMRNLAGGAKDLAFLKFKNLINRLQSNLNDLKDPYNTFLLINKLSHNTTTALQYFILIGDYSKYDKNPNYKTAGFRELIKTLSNNYPIGLHPSYNSYNDFAKIEIEKKRVEDIIEKKVTSARCHFLRVNLPETYREFIKCGITDDYTMIYASQSGFRTGLCVPHLWFDLKNNKQTNLTIHTSVLMEGTLRDYNNLRGEEAKIISRNLMLDVKKYGGEFISIFHNDSFVPQQKDWIDLYKDLLVNSK